MTLEQLIARARADHARLLEARAQQTVQIAELRSREVRGEQLEEGAVQALLDARGATDQQLAAAELRIANLEAELVADQRADAAAQQTTRTGTQLPAYDQTARVGAEERTYRQDQDPKGKVFLRDVGLAFLGDPSAAGRLARHMQEEAVERGGQVQRAAGTGAFAGLTVPQYLTDLFAPLARAGRPFADVCRHHDLPPDGMTVNISRLTTGTTVAIQSAENAAVAEQDPDDTLLTESVKTGAGQVTLSRQAIDRGVGIEDATLEDLFRAYATNIDSTLINEATTGLSAVVAGGNTVAYTDASPTAAELWPKLLDAQGRIEEALGDVQADDIIAVMRSRRYAWLRSQVGPNWPFITASGTPTMTGGSDDGKPYGSGYRGNVAGLNIVTDNNIPNGLGAGTNEDEIYIVDRNECHLWEDPDAPLLIRAEQTKAASLGVLFVVYGYFAYSFRRYPLAVAKIGGTGLVTPTF